MSKNELHELRIMQDRERNRLIRDAMQGQELTPVQQKQLQLELEHTTVFVNGDLIATDEEGQPLRDQHGWETPISDHIKSTAKALFNLSPQTTPQVKAPATADELFWRLREAKTTEEQQALHKAFKER